MSNLMGIVWPGERTTNQSPRVTTVESLRKKSTVELLEISMDGCSGGWTLDALDAAREIIKERAPKWPEYTEAFAQVKGSPIQQDDAPKSADFKIKAALRGIKLPPSVRLALTIAAGVFLGLLAMRVLSSVLRHL